MRSIDEPVVKCPACGGEGILPGPRVCNRCAGLGIRARETEAHVVKTCSCGRAHDRAGWVRLDFVGHQNDGEGGDLELRNCECGSTIALPLAKVAA